MLLTIIALSATISLSAQNCNNQVKNNSANNASVNWETQESAAIANLAGGNKAFKVMTSDANLYQDIKIPEGSKTAYFGGWTRNSQNNAATGHAYLYAYVMDADDEIIQYVQFDVTKKGMAWAYQDKTINLKSNAVRVRFFLKKSAKNGVADTGNIAYFDNLVLTFDCERKNSKPKSY